LTKQRAKIAAAERALRRGFVQFRDVEPVNRILHKRDRDVINQHDDVIDFSSDDAPTSHRTSIVKLFTDVSSPAALATSSSSSSPSDAAAGENDVSHETVMTSYG